MTKVYVVDYNDYGAGSGPIGAFSTLELAQEYARKRASLPPDWMALDCIYIFEFELDGDNRDVVGNRIDENTSAPQPD